MRTIAIINQKGGCGKTTVSINLGAVLAGKGYRTLLIDMDPQSHCALGLSVPESRIQRSTADLIQAGLDGSMSVHDVVWQVCRNLDLAPSSMALAGIEQRLATAPDRDRRLTQVLSTVQDHYDYCIIDCPPSIGLLTFNALRACDEVIIPVETGYFALQGSVRQAQTIEMVIRRVGHRVRFSVLPTMYDVRTKLAREILGELKRHFGQQVLPVVINFNAKLKEAASFGQPITEYDAGCKGMQDFEELTGWLMANPPDPPTAVEPLEGETENTENTEKQSDFATVGAGAGVGVDAEQNLAHANDNGRVHVRPAQPMLSRAAELAERARVLTTRTAALSARLSRDRDYAAESESTLKTDPAPAPGNTPKSVQPADHAGLTPAQRAERLEQKIEQLYGARNTAKGAIFVQPPSKARNLALAGDFNDWNPSRTPMQYHDQLGVWQATVNLPPGRYRYRLVADGQWVQDPYNPTTETNPFGELNNVIEIPA